MDDLPVWSLCCIRVRPGHRKKGVSHALIAGAVEFARAHGAPAVEAYPLDNGDARVDLTMAYPGLRKNFERAGFTWAADTTSVLSGHPRIGDRTAGGASRREQSAVAGADQDVLDALAEGNRAYEERFGHVYLVCATGRGAQELLDVLQARLGNDPATERAVALAELAAINRLRLARMVEEN